MPEIVSLEFKDREGWRRWLEQNHATVKEAWVTICKARSSRPGVSYEEAVDEAARYGWIDGKMRSLDEHSFTIRFSPRRGNSPWSLSNRARAERLMHEGAMAEAGLRAVEKAKASGRWDAAYTSRVTPEVPGDLAEALRADSEAWRNFQAFSNSVKLMYVHWVGEARRDETRARRIAEVVSRAARNIKPT